MKKPSPLLLIFLVVFIDLLTMGMVLPALPYYAKIVEGSAVPWLADNRALIVGALGASYALMAFVFTPILGGMSDRYGRRPILLLSLLGTSISFALLGLANSATFLGIEAVLAMLFVSRLLDGITGGNISTAQAYIADVTPPEERARGLGTIGAAFGLGFMLGPAIGGLLTTYISLEAPAFAAAILSLVNVAFGFFGLPESLPAEKRSTAATGDTNAFAQLGSVFSNGAIRSLLVGYLLLNFAFAGLQSNFAVFTDVRFGFTAGDNAWIFALIGVVAVIMQGFLLRKLVPLYGEARLAVAGFALMSIAFLLTAFAPAGWMLFPAMAVLAAGSGLATPSITSLISRRVTAQEQGRTLGSVQAFSSLMMVVGPLYAGFVFEAGGPNAPYTTGSLFVLAGALVIAMALLPEFARRPEMPPRPTTRSVEQGIPAE
jgi:MFS transporter, DHA1 family, tetracycline resistance protein